MNLVELSKEKGFISRNKLITVNDDYFYLWMCELQKWLRDEHNLSVEINVGENKWEYSIYSIKGFTDTALSGVIFNKYEQALEEGLSHALKLINNK